MQAMEAEMRGDYKAAADLYKEGLEASEADWGDAQPSEVEMDLWEDSRLQVRTWRQWRECSYLCTCG